jgi:hypothetical protein
MTKHSSTDLLSEDSEGPDPYMNICLAHHRQLELICVDDKQRICS